METRTRMDDQLTTLASRLFLALFAGGIIGFEGTYLMVNLRAFALISWSTAPLRCWYWSQSISGCCLASQLQPCSSILRAWRKAL
jgi:hypothetical protein